MATSPTIQNQELRAECGVTLGRPILIALDYTVVGDVTTIHSMGVADVLDKVVLSLWNTTSSAIVTSIIISPNDDTVLADVDAATVSVSVPANATLELPDLYVRYDSGNSYTIAAYVSTGDVNNISVTKRVIRYALGLLSF